jgi:hypothetical protein
MSKRYTLSDAASKEIERQAIRFKVSEKQVLEWMVNEFTPSTTEEKENQSRERSAAYRTFKFNTEYTPTIHSAWMNGYISGWNLFQSRKSKSIYKLLAEKKV